MVHVSRAADQFGQVGAKSTQAALGVVVGGQATVCGGVGGQVLDSTLGKIVTRHALEHGRFSWVLAPLGSQGLIPLCLCETTI